MKKLAASVVVVMLIITTAVVISCNNQSKTKPAKVAESANKDSLIKRGEYLVTIMGCDDCHSPKKLGPNGPEPDMDRRLSGHPSQMPLGDYKQSQLKSWVLFNQSLTAFVGPWGVSYAANLTSDATGIGSWTEKQFLKALREGKYKGLDNSRQMLPPMPWANFSKASDEDLKAIFAFLKATRPVQNNVPSPVPPNAIAAR